MLRAGVDGRNRILQVDQHLRRKASLLRATAWRSQGSRYSAGQLHRGGRSWCCDTRPYTGSRSLCAHPARQWEVCSGKCLLPGGTDAN
eukprot:scaffold4991_cov417-Prasinococcus_capsulatus_cf.AAC.4